MFAQISDITKMSLNLGRVPKSMTKFMMSTHPVLCPYVQRSLNDLLFAISCAFDVVLCQSWANVYRDRVAIYMTGVECLS